MGFLEAGQLRNWLGEHIGLSLVGPKLEEATNMRETVNYQRSPGYLWLIVTENSSLTSSRSN